MLLPIGNTERIDDQAAVLSWRVGYHRNEKLTAKPMTGEAELHLIELVVDRWVTIESLLLDFQWRRAMPDR